MPKASSPLIFMNLASNVRPETPSDYPRITQIHKLAFNRPNEADLIDLIRQSNRYIPGLTLVAEIDEMIVGHIVYSEINLVNQETISVLGLAPLAVHPEFQNRGIGSQLVQVSLTLAKIRQYPLIIVLGDPKFYAKFGFQPSVDYQIHSPFPVPEEYFMVKVFNDKIQHQGNIIYPQAFSQV